MVFENNLKIRPFNLNEIKFEKERLRPRGLEWKIRVS